MEMVKSARPPHASCFTESCAWLTEDGLFLRLPADRWVILLFLQISVTSGGAPRNGPKVSCFVGCKDCTEGQGAGPSRRWQAASESCLRRGVPAGRDADNRPSAAPVRSAYVARLCPESRRGGGGRRRKERG